MNLKMDALKSLTRMHWLIVVGALTLVIAGTFGWLLAGALAQLGADPKVPSFLQRSGDDTALYAIIEARERSIVEQNEIAKRLPAIKQRLAGMSADIEAARKRLPSDSEKSTMRQLIEDLGRQVGAGASALLVKSVQIREAAPAAGRARSASDYRTVEYNTTVSTDMDGLIQFINLIERHERFMTIEGIQITPGGVAADSKAQKVEFKPHTAVLRIVTYIDSTASVAGAR